MHTTIIEQLSTLRFDTLEELLNELNEHFQVALAVFDSSNLIRGISAEMYRCKCYYMLLHSRPNQCSIFEPAFVNSVLSNSTDTNTLCDYGCRITLRVIHSRKTQYKIVMFQYNLPDDNLDFNPTNSSNYTPLYRNTDASVIGYFWKPNVLSAEAKELLFKFLEDGIRTLKIL